MGGLPVPADGVGAVIGEARNIAVATAPEMMVSARSLACFRYWWVAPGRGAEEIKRGLAFQLLPGKLKGIDL